MDVGDQQLLDEVRLSGRGPDRLDPHASAVAGGAVRIDVSGNVVGVLAASGLISSVRADDDLAMDALVELATRGVRSPPPRVERAGERV